MKNLILSAEGPSHMSKRLWATHKILGAFDTRDEAIKAIPGDYGDEDIVLLTDLTTGKAERLPIEPKEICSSCETPVQPGKLETMLIRDDVTDELFCVACNAKR